MLHLILYYYIKSVQIRKFNWLSYSVFHSDTPINALKFLDVVNMKDTQQKSQFYKSTLIEAMPLIPRVSGAHILLLLFFFSPPETDAARARWTNFWANELTAH